MAPPLRWCRPALRASRRSAAVEPATGCSGQVGDDQLVGMVDHPPKLAVLDGTVEFDGIPVPLVLVVTGTDRFVARSQLQGQIWVAFEVHAARAALKRNKGEHAASDLEHRHALTERVVLDCSRQGGTQVEHVVSRHEVCGWCRRGGNDEYGSS